MLKMSRRPYVRPDGLALARLLLLAGLLLPLGLPAPAAGAPAARPADKPPSQLSDEVWVLKDGYPLIDPNKVAVPEPGNNYTTHSVQLTASGMTHRKFSSDRSPTDKFDVNDAFDVTYTHVFPALPKELVPGQDLVASASVNVAIANGRAVTYDARMRTEWRSLPFEPNRNSALLEIQAGQSCTSAGVCSLLQGAATMNSGSFRQTLTVPPVGRGPTTISLDGVPTIEIVIGVSDFGPGSRYINPRAIVWQYVAGRPSLDAGPSDQCAGEEAAFEELNFRRRAYRLALERDRTIHSQLDAAHEDIRSSTVAGLVLDLVGMHEGWPLAAGVANRIFDAGKHELANSLLKAGFKSVETRIIKDQSLASVGDQLTKLDFSTGLPIDGAIADVGWEGVKSGLEGAMGKGVARGTFFVFDMLKFGINAYEGMNQLDASREMLRTVNEHLFQLGQMETAVNDHLTDAQSAFELCQHRASLRLPPNRADYLTSWDKVQAFLAEHN